MRARRRGSHARASSASRGGGPPARGFAAVLKQARHPRLPSHWARRRAVARRWLSSLLFEVSRRTGVSRPPRWCYCHGVVAAGCRNGARRDFRDRRPKKIYSSSSLQDRAWSRIGGSRLRGRDRAHCVLTSDTFVKATPDDAADGRLQSATPRLQEEAAGLLPIPHRVALERWPYARDLRSSDLGPPCAHAGVGIGANTAIADLQHV